MDTSEDGPIGTRRRFLVGTLAGALASVLSETALAQDGSEGDGNESGESGEGGDAGGGNETGGEGNETAGGGGGGTEEVSTGPGGDFVFEPDQLTIQPGTTVHWIWESDNHNVNPTEQPEDAAWEGHQEIESEGFEYEFTFEVEGDYHYVCDPHVSQGMEGDITVDPNAAAGGGDGGPAQTVPDAAMLLLIATVVGMIATLSLAYGFLRYGGKPS